MSTFDAIDLSALPAPAMVETISYEALLANRKAQMRKRLAGILPDWNPDLESDPIVAQLEESAYNEMLLRQRVNDGGHAVMLAYAGGSDLDHLAALFAVARLTGESDTAFRRRVQMALEGISTAGSVGGYVFHALSADARVKDVAVTSPAAGCVEITILSHEGSGTASDDLLAGVTTALSADTVRPLTDQIQVRAAAITLYQLDADLTIAAGPDASVVRQSALAAVTQVVAARHGLGVDVPLSALYAALHQPGVIRVTLHQPAADILCAPLTAAYCFGIRVGGA